MAEGLFNDRAERFGLPARASSVGLWREGEPATPHGVRVMADRGIDTSAHRSRILAPDHVASADLVVGLAREHVREAVVLDQDCFRRAFTLKELVRRGEDEGGARRPGESLNEWAERLTEDRSVQSLLGVADADDVADPIGRPLRAYRTTADEIEDLIDRMIAVAWPQAAADRASA